MAILTNTSANNILSKLPGPIQAAGSFQSAITFQNKFQTAPGLTDFKAVLLLGLDKDKKPSARIVTQLKKNGTDLTNDQIYDGANSIPTQEYESTTGFKIFAKNLLDSNSRQLAGDSQPTIIVPARTFNADFFEAAIPSAGHYDAPRPFEKSTHAGIDYKLTLGDAVFAARDGVVREVFNEKNAGNTVTINHESNLTLITGNQTIEGILHTRYLHADKNLVKVGQEVTAETQIQNAGQTGNAKGECVMCHIEARLVTDMKANLLAAHRVDPNVLLENKNVVVPTILPPVNWTDLIVTWAFD